jgi:hypothetical protein
MSPTTRLFLRKFEVRNACIWASISGLRGVKALLIDGDQKPVAQTTAPLDVQRSHPGWSEQMPGRLDRSDEAGARSSKAIARASACRRARHRALRPHARRDIAWKRRRSAPSLHPVERYAQPRRSGGTRCRSAISRSDRQHRFPRLHRAEARLGRAKRAGCLRQGREGPAAEGLSAVLADRRAHLRDVGFGRHVLARCRQTELVGRTPLGVRADARADAPRSSKAPRSAAICGPTWQPNSACRRAYRLRAAPATMRPRLAGMGTVSEGGRLRVARHIRRAVRGQCELPPQSRKCRPRLLPCAPPAPGTKWASSCRRPTASTGMPVRWGFRLGPDIGAGRDGAPAVLRFVPALSLRRAHAAQ